MISALCIGAGILGNTVGYIFGRRVGPAMYNWKDRFLFKKKYLRQAHDFFEKHGGVAIIGARFLPFIRTFTPIVAGIVQMDRTGFRFTLRHGQLISQQMKLGSEFLKKAIRMPLA